MAGAFAPGEYVVYPTHGVGQVLDLAEQEIAGTTIRVLVIQFPRDGMTLRIPEGRVSKSGLRSLLTAKEMAKALSVLSDPPRRSSLPWIRQGKLLEEKINSGDPKMVAEIVRDLHGDNPSNSARRIYESALARLVQELALIEGVEDADAQSRIEARLGQPKAA